MMVSARMRDMILKWAAAGYDPKDIARQTRLPVDEIRAVIFAGTPKPVQPVRPEFIEPPCSTTSDAAPCFCVIWVFTYLNNSIPK